MSSLTPNAPYALVVDDDFMIRMDATEILEEAGFRVLEAEHGDAAYELLKTRHPEVMLLFTDVQMPGELDGFALARNVSVSWPHISIIVASGHARPGSGSLPHKARFLAKPFSAALIRTHIQEILPNGWKLEGLRHPD
ncbi:MAG: response regulator [Janthinobacterium lividum]